MGKRKQPHRNWEDLPFLKLSISLRLLVERRCNFPFGAQIPDRWELLVLGKSRWISAKCTIWTEVQFSDRNQDTGPRPPWIWVYNWDFLDIPVIYIYIQIYKNIWIWESLLSNKEFTFDGIWSSFFRQPPCSEKNKTIVTRQKSSYHHLGSIKPLV